MTIQYFRQKTLNQHKIENFLALFGQFASPLNPSPFDMVTSGMVTYQIALAYPGLSSLQMHQPRFIDSCGLVDLAIILNGA